jgi:hypothetical protein
MFIEELNPRPSPNIIKVQKLKEEYIKNTRFPPGITVNPGYNKTLLYQV